MKIINEKDIKANEKRAGIKDKLAISQEDGATSFRMLLFEIAPGCRNNDKGEMHAWEHGGYVTSGSGLLKSGDKEFKITKGDAIFTADNDDHTFINNGTEPLKYVLFTEIPAK
jgi:quercetin dioxygenase-like cupin family protein